MVRDLRHILVLFSISLGVIFPGCIGGSSADDEYHPGLGTPRLSISSSQSELFGGDVYIDQTAEQSFTICNTGSAAATNMGSLTLSAPFSFLDGSYPGTGGNCGTSLNAGVCCTMAVGFTPDDTSSQAATLQITYRNGPDSTTKSVSTALEKTGRSGTSGTIDTQSFGDNGVATSEDLGIGHGRGATDAHVRAMALDADNKVVAVGYVHNGANNDFAIMRYNVNGLLDNTFGTEGMTTTAVSGNDIAHAVAIQSDGKIVVAGSTGLARYTTAGVLDTSFSTDGIVAGFASYLWIQSDGKILAANDFTVRRYLESGTLDATISLDNSFGQTCTGIFVSSIAMQSDGKFLVGGNIDTNAFCIVDLALDPDLDTFPSFIARYNADGSIDTTFQGAGYAIGVLGDFSDISAIVPLSGGKTLVGGFSSDTSELMVLRLNSNGSLDGTFNSTGIWSAEDFIAPRSLAVASDGKILLAYEGSLIRLEADGGLDTTFNGTGSLATPASNGYSMKLQPNGKIVLGGSTVIGGQRVFTITRIWP